MDLLVATGFRKPVCNLKLADRPAILSALMEYHLMAKMKAEMDQFKEGLNVLGFLDIVKRKAGLWEPFFIHCESNVLGFLDIVKRKAGLWEPFFIHCESKITAGRTVHVNLVSYVL